MTSTNLPLIELRNVSKSYGGVHAVRDLSFNVSPGEIHAICGENGAGKSTLIRLLAGITVPDHGEIFIQNQRLALGIVKASESAGIAVMHQESTAFPDLNAIDNIFVGREITRLAGWILDRSEMKQQTRKLLERIGEQVPLNVPIGSLPLAQRQMVALARALSHDCRLLIMDEPTASLSYRETQVLLQIVRQLREQGVSVLYVSHRLEEIFSIADRVTVLRDGQLVGTRFVRDVDSSELIRMMVGRDIEVVSRMGTPARPLQNKVLEVDHLTKTGIFDDISFTVHSGEILGLTGLVGAGRSEIVRAIFGIDRYDSGNVRVLGKSLTCGSV
ncbi:MAG: sugar ABC transporter ATP-binding protein, partial [Planctomycetes bacterium]|nr:sugar ABC transporter ATP-binding protein [Planctomycetota bacterium]